jgi:hypothetical protein
MENLFNLRKLFTAAYQAKALCHRVLRSWCRGVPSLVVMKEEKNPNEADKLRGATKAAILKGDATCPNLICSSVYDSKPVHLMSTSAECIEWNEKARKIWSNEHRSHVQMRYLRLNLIDQYNYNMNSADMADQLRTAIASTIGFGIENGGGRSFYGPSVSM